MRIQAPTQKLVYSLRDVCRLTGLSDAVIKRWEEQFSQINPVRNRASNRNYTPKDLKMIFYIRDLIYVQKLGEEAVEEKLKSYNPAEDDQSPSYFKGILAEIKLELHEIRQLLQD